MTTSRASRLSRWTAAIALFLCPVSVCVASCPLVLTGAPSDAGLGTAVVIPGDLNGDGHIDFACGATTFDSGGQTIAGRVAVFFGGPSADATPDLHLNGAALGDRFGYALASAGDLNFDGHADLVVGAYQNDAGGSNAGRAYVFFGGPTLDAVPDLVLTGATAGEQFGISVDGAGDVNGDGRADLIVGARFNAATGFESGRAYVYFGGPAVDTTPDVIVSGHGGGERLGFTVARGGDVNDDGGDDFLVGAYHNSISAAQAGRCYVYFGGPGVDGTADQILEGEGDFAHFSDGLASGDVNDDGHSDILVGASQYAGAAGRAYVYFGGPAFDATVDITLDSPASGAWFGRCVSGGGDLNGDGHGDFLVGAPELGFGGTGRVLLYHGGPGVDATADAILHGESIGDAFGWNATAVAGGDTDGNGIDELLAGAFRNDAAGPDVGRAYLYRSVPCPRLTCPPDSVPPLALKLQLKAQDGDVNFGVAVLTPGDLNSDGHDDVVVGADGGRVYLYFGGPATDDVPDVVFSSAFAGDRFGYVATASDVNGDGALDVVVGAFLGDNHAGRVYVYFGGPGIDALADRVLNGLPGEQHGIAVDGVGDVNADGWEDLLVGARFNNTGGFEAGRAYVYYGGPASDASADLVIPAQTAGERMGFTVARGGDLNGDGHADFLVGAYHNSLTNFETGRAYVYFGGPGVDGTPDVVLEGEGFRAHFSDGLAAADVNDDGHADVLVGASQIAGAAGRAYVYFGGPGMDATADLVLDPGIAGDWFGRFVSGGADLNLDLHPDFVVGAPSANNGGPGFVAVYHGGPNVDAACDGILIGENDGDQFGWASCAVGSDVNADGVDEILIGAFTYREATAAETAGFAVGKAYLYRPFGPVPVYVDDLRASVHESGIQLSWRLHEQARREVAAVRIQRGLEALGPYEDVTAELLVPEVEMSYLDTDAPRDRSLWYRLAVQMQGGAVVFAGPIRVDASNTGLVRTALHAAREVTPERVDIRYAVGTRAAVRLDIFDVAGRRVHSMERGVEHAGEHVATWDRTDAAGKHVARGVYALHLRVGNERFVRKVVLLRP